MGHRRTVKTGGLHSFSIEKEKKIIKWEQEFVYNTELHQQLRE